MGDIKAANIFIERRESGAHAKLLDFGLARVLTKKAEPLGGSPHWAAPEVFHRGKPDPSSDVFSFARVIFFVIVGKKPLEGTNKKAISRAAKTMRALPLAWPQEPSEMQEW